MRWIKHGPFVNKDPWIAVNGADQGDAFSLIAVNLFFLIWIMRLKSQCPDMLAATFVDDSLQLLPIDKSEQLRIAWHENVTFERLTGQRTNFDKTWTFGTTPKARKAITDALPMLKLTANDAALGYDVRKMFF